MLKVTRITRNEEFLALRETWNQCLRHSDHDTVFLTWDWLYTWWEVYGVNKDLSILIFRDDDGQCVGIAPFCVAHERAFGIPIRVMKLIGSEEVCSEYLDVIVHKARANDVKRATAVYLQSAAVRWDILFFSDVREDSNIGAILNEWSRTNKTTIHERIQTTNPFLRLPGREEVYLAGLGQNRRGSIQRKARKLEREHGFVISSITDGSDLDKAFAAFVALHQRAWTSRGLPGMFKRRRFLEFHHRIARRFAASDWLRLWFLLTGNTAVASLYGFHYRDTFYYYQSGFDPDWKPYGVGMVLLNHTILEAIRSNLNEYDFLRGDAAYKWDFTNTFRHTREIIAGGATYKARLYLAQRDMRRSARGAARRLLPRRLAERASKIRDHLVLR